MVPYAWSVRISSSMACGTRPSMMWTALTPLRAASSAPLILGSMPPEMVPSANSASISFEVRSVSSWPALSSTPGVLDKSGRLLTDLSAREIDELFADGTLSGGMLPKIASALDAAKNGVNSVHIIDGRVPHAMLLEVLTDQAYGTLIRSR